MKTITLKPLASGVTKPCSVFGCTCNAETVLWVMGSSQSYFCEFHAKELCALEMPRVPRFKVVASDNVHDLRCNHKGTEHFVEDQRGMVIAYAICGSCAQAVANLLEVQK